mmetsp:Transcript_14292/g.24331  ORF Transcript_14292/g.24331 Transcript_14292/m.24331 type:complete len:83 (+) Transcript_14292:361-609(+)
MIPQHSQGCVQKFSQVFNRFSNCSKEQFDYVQQWFIVEKIIKVGMIGSQRSQDPAKRWNLLCDFWGFVFARIDLSLPQFNLK